MTTLLNIFYNDLNSLKLDQFPCGTGSWRQDKLPGYEQDGDVNHETLQSLEELSRSEIFQVHTSWSDDIKDLRELSVKNPGIITEAFIFKHFKTLRLIDRNINEVDRGLLKFVNLEQLSLTGNSLTEIPGSHLPRSLSVLQIFANKFTDLLSLTVNVPPNLQHLGVGYNQLTDITSFISPYYWPNLLSLDLSYNKISHLEPTVECLATLASLRNLSLTGNPINLAPGYTGCILDCMPRLNILDDTSISDDDRLNFTGISREAAIKWDQAIFTVMFPTLENLRKPPENEPIDEAGFIFPNQKKQLYHIQFSFAADPPVFRPGTGVDCPGTRPGTTTPTDLNGPVPSSVEGEEREGEVVFSTTDIPWSEEPMVFSVPVIVRCSDLSNLEEFLTREIQFTLVEKTIESWTVIAPPDSASVTPPPSGGKKKGGGAPKDDKKKKKADPGTGEKPIKDKEGNILKWEEGPPTLSEIAHVKTSIKNLLAVTECGGKMECVVTEKLPTPQPESGRNSSQSAKGKKKDTKAVKKGKAPTPVVEVAPPEPLQLEFQISRVKWQCSDDHKRWSEN